MAVSTRTKKRPMSEINVVPYIDVMLVLLVIFMITAPLLTTGVEVELPKAAAQPMDNEAKEPMVVTVNVDGDYFINIGEDQKKPISDAAMITRVAAVLRHQPGTPVMIRGDSRVEYAKVVYAMTLLQRAGAPSVGLVTESPDQPTRKRSRKSSHK